MSTRIPESRTTLRVEQPDNPNFIPITATFHTPHVIYPWRYDLFKAAAAESLTQPVSAERSWLLLNGCREATSSSQTFDPLSRGGIRVLGHGEQALINLIGIEKFKVIFNASPPPELIDHILSDEHRESLKYHQPLLEEITIEVARGRLGWEDRFAAAGVPTPEEFAKSVRQWKAFQYLRRHLPHKEIITIGDELQKENPLAFSASHYMDKP